MKRISIWRPAVLVTMILTFLSFCTSGSRSGEMASTRSISPFSSAFTWVCWSGMASHSTRSTFTTLAPAMPEGASLRGLYLSNLT